MKYLFALLLVPLFFITHSINIHNISGFYTKPQGNTAKTKAFKVLQHKCNTCHATKKRVDIFTYENMDSLSKVINQQVFIKKKMPKGKKNTLSAMEQQDLKAWLNTLLRKGI